MIGKSLNNRYEVLEHIGEGATATVFKGRDTLLGRTVALKVLLPHVRENTRERFFQEAMAAAQLNHANIMAIYDRGEDDGRHFLVVEYVQGESLGAYIPSTPDVVVQLGAQIARALDYAHERDIIHRDIKPANIMVTTEGQIKIMDLGLALPREAKRVTAPGMVIGTPAYISPEQAQGKDLDRRTDIYSLGIVLYEMATGQLPFNADDITALLLQHVRQPAPSPRLIVADLPVGIERVILKTLEKQPNRRFQTGRSLAESLEAAFHLPAEDGRSLDITYSSRPDVTRTISTGNVEGTRSIRIVLADDHVLLRRSLASLLEQHEQFVVLAEVGDGDAALQQAIDLQPDVLLLDLNMPNKGGLEVLPHIRRQAPNVKVLVLTGREDNIYIMRALRAGAHGYLLKSIDEEALFESIFKVMRNEMVLGKGVAERVVGGLLDTGNSQSADLTNAERDILLHVGAGYDNDAISRRMNISMGQMIEIMASLLNKLKVRDRSEATLKALRDGLISLEDLHEIPPPK